jgi:hypothetical protein
LLILYENVTREGNEPLAGLNATFLQIGNLSYPPASNWTFCVSGLGREHCFVIRSSVVKSFIIAVPSQGNYSVIASSDLFSGFLVTDEGDSILAIESNHFFVPWAQCVRFTAPTQHFTVHLESMFHSRRAFVLSVGIFMLMFLDFS